MTPSVVYGPSVLLDAGGNKWTNLADPASGQDATTKAYVDALVNGAEWKQQSRLATAAALPTNVYANGSSGVGATLTGMAFGALTIDGVTPAVGNRVLVKNEAAPANNGIYTVTVVGAIAALYVLTRATDYDQAAEVVAGTATFVTEGTANADTAWVQTTTGTITFGSTSLVFVQFGGGSGVSFATPAIVLGTAAAAGAASTVIRSDSTIVAFDATVPSTQAFGDSASAGSAAVAARRDHKHAMPATPVTSITRSARSSNTILAAADKGTVIAATAAYTQTLTAAATLGAGWWCIVQNNTQDGTTVLTLDPNASETIDGLTTITMYSGETRLLECDGGNFTSQLLEGGFAKFTPTGGTFVVPAGITACDVVCIGAGGQGGGGVSGASSNSASGGGGGGGAVSRATIPVSALGAAGSSITVTVPAGGTGSGTPGNDGGNGSATTFGSLLKAGGGGGGKHAITTTGGAGGGGGSAINSGSLNTGGAPSSTTQGIGMQSGAGAIAGATGTASEWGGASGAGGTAGTNVGLAGGSSVYGGPGGGAGAGSNSSTQNGGAGGGNQSITAGGGAAGGINATLAGVGSSGSGSTPFCGTGGGGGAAYTSGTAGAGGVGGVGAGGGGGAACFNGTGGTGGNGGAGECRVWYS